ncbi:MAG: GxxExxY protein [Candidatus Moranbacteria bacterium CG_4_10_14_3_um_filter_44_15]|nr:MAG: GxxExxY protein [Candidatus Moranbacteria bacterium CG17_big_fil_post_rev_8_21_14_2_50_44_12]PIW93221.1 MAG: GxxExxY protein [Candidatus Moranbacteria bacterium CG_4_8_14_3_um_filter_43_15]PIX90880.1 MAG: GxxExxY protein [Candidatus Moranbacteria bacterium CG_4_10_14_3_um_filter_44_15]PJA86119.1 MAG: GxxExxY protein [Candidatus Moranbacteria bacterium CG_4_9_14_3_um_filter_44_28]
MKTKKKLIFAEECYQIMGIVFKVYKELGFGHKENVYQKALAKEFKNSGFEFVEQLRYKLKYKEEMLGIYILDFLVFGKIILEIKQRSFISSKDIDQIYKYLRAKNLKLGIIITFTNDGVRFKRIVNLR